jgi:hypothetical protein
MQRLKKHFTEKELDQSIEDFTICTTRKEFEEHGLDIGLEDFVTNDVPRENRNCMVDILTDAINKKKLVDRLISDAWHAFQIEDIYLYY